MLKRLRLLPRKPEFFDLFSQHAALAVQGATERLSAVKWGLTRDIAAAWLFTLPASALVGGGFAKLAVLALGG